MSQRPEPPPEGAVIKEAMDRSGISARKAAPAAGISEGRWRQIVSGYQVVSAGHYAPVRGPADTLARMAAVVGTTPDELEKAGRSDAAAILRQLLDDAATAESSSPTNTESPGPDETAMMQMLAALKEEIRQLKEQVQDLRGERDRENGRAEYRKGA